MNLWKKSAIGASLVISAAAAAATALTIGDVNQRMVDLLAPLNNDTSKAKVEFTALKADDIRVLDFGVNGLVYKISEKNEVTLEVPNFNYVYEGPDGAPRFDTELKMTIDLLKAFPQTFLNTVLEDVDATLQDLAKSLLEEYGDAVTLSSESDVDRDDNGNVVGLRLRGEVSFDLSKLPESIPVSDVPILKASVDLQADLNGGSLVIEGDMNKKYKGFSEDQDGLKEIIEGLLNNDKESYKTFEMVVGFVNRAAEWLVNKSPEENSLKSLKSSLR